MSQHATRPSHPLIAPGTGLLRLYNQFPRLYGSIAELTDHLPVIADLGFNAVWVNPLQVTGDQVFDRTERWDRTRMRVRGSLYAMSDPEQLAPRWFGPAAHPSRFDPSAFDADHAVALRRYTDTARQLGLVPMFDLVMNHLALDSPVVSGTAPWFRDHGIDTTSWFIVDTAFDDVRKFNYPDPVVFEQALTHFWRPFVEKYVRVYGFAGRIDVAWFLPREVQHDVYGHLDRLCRSTHGTPAVIFGEVVYHSRSKPTPDIVAEMQGSGMTHMTNSLFSGRTQEVLEDLADKQKLHPENSVGAGGTVGFAASHDTVSLNHHAVSQIAQKRGIPAGNATPREGNASRQREAIRRLRDQETREPDAEVGCEMRRRMALAALGSDAGWYLLSGDEVGDPWPKWVFLREDGEAVYGQPGDWRTGWRGRHDHRAFVRALNECLDRLPPVRNPVEVEVCEAADRPNELIVLRRTARNQIDAVVVNLTDTERPWPADWLPRCLTAADWGEAGRTHPLGPWRELPQEP